MKIRNKSNYPKYFKGVKIMPGETEEVETSEQPESYYLEVEGLQDQSEESEEPASDQADEKPGKTDDEEV